MTVIKYTLAIALIVALLSVSVTWTVLQWNECRDMDHSFFYCLGHALK